MGSETISVLCIALTFTCTIQIITCGLMAFTFSQFMPILLCIVPTAAGLLSGFVSVPTVVQLRASYTSLHGREYGYTIWYKRLAIGTCTILQFIACVITLVYINKMIDAGAFLELMGQYGYKQSSKSIVDNLQWFLQCCGSIVYTDWYAFNWGGYVFDANGFRKRNSIAQILMSDDSDEYPDLTTLRRDAVPFSCCMELTTSACVHGNLRQLGTYTINQNGCTEKLNGTKDSILWIQFGIYIISFLMQVIILISLFRSDDNSDNSDSMKDTHKKLYSGPKKSYSRFVNEAK